MVALLFAAWNQIPAKALRPRSAFRAVQRSKQSAGLSIWLASLTARKRKQVATVALPNKMSRMAWAVLFKGEAFRPPLVAQTIAA